MTQIHPRPVHGLGTGAPTPDCFPVATEVVLGSPTTLGDGTPGSVTTAQIQTALDAGGEILFDVGAQPVTIELDSELVVSRETVLDGAGVVTLSGSDQQRVFLVTNPNNAFYTFTLQNLSVAHGSTPSESGAGIYKPSGGPWQAVSLVAVNCSFHDNTAIAVDQDGGGGAIYATGMDEVLIQSCSFENNQGSNGGAIYSLGSRRLAVAAAEFIDNHATGVNGNPGSGGNGGAVGVDGAEREATFCGVDFVGNRGNAFGIGFFSVMYDVQSITSFNACTFDDNRNPGTFGLAGGAYIQGGPFGVYNTTFSANEAPGAGAIFLGPDAVGEIVNTTLNLNIATDGLGGGLFISTGDSVAITNSTIAGNLAPCPVCFAAGIQVDAVNGVTLKNTVLSDNVGGNEFNPWNIRNGVGDGGGNIQWPEERPNGQPEQPATPTVIWADPLLQALGDNGGPTHTMPPGPGSPALDGGVEAGAPPADQRGVTRDPPIDVGAVEGLGEQIFLDGFDSGSTSAWDATIDD